jgi:hypothetical protein
MSKKQQRRPKPEVKQPTTSASASSSVSSMKEDKQLVVVDETEDPSSKQLLAYASIRVQHQRMNEEMKALKSDLLNKDELIVQLTGQLRRATVTKCDLVLACTDMEREKERAEKYGSPQTQQVKAQYLEMLEGRATMEREFMNELAALTNELLATDRRYKNEIVDKEFTIGQLEENVRHLTTQLADMELAERLAERTKEVRKSLLVAAKME